MHSMLMFLFGLSSTAFETQWLKFLKKNSECVGPPYTIFLFLRGFKAGKRKMGSSCPRG